MYILHFYIYILKLLPFQGALLLLALPRAMPWAKSFCPFRANRGQPRLVKLLYFGSFKESLLKNLMFLSNGFFTSSMQTSMMSRRMMRMPTA